MYINYQCSTLYHYTINSLYGINNGLYKNNNKIKNK